MALLQSPNGLRIFCLGIALTSLLGATPLATAQDQFQPPGTEGHAGENNSLQDLFRNIRGFLSGSAQNAPAPASAPSEAKPKAPQFESQDPIYRDAVGRARQRIDNFNQALKSGNDIKVRETALALQKDPIAVQIVNSAEPSPAANFFKERLNLTLDTVKANTKNGVRAQIAQQYGVEAKDVTFFEATNPSKAPKVGQDWDVTVRVDGKDIPVRVAQDIVHDAFYQAANGHPPKSRAQARSFAHQQAVEVINYLGAEAYGGSQREGGRVIKGPKDQPLRDPAQISNAIEVKSNLPRERALQLEGRAARLEAWAEKLEARGDTSLAGQARNMAHELRMDAQGQWVEQSRQYWKQYEKQIAPRVNEIGGEVPQHVKKGSEILRQVAEGEISPAEGRTKLKLELGETPETLINKSAGLVESAQVNRGPGRGAPPPDVLPENVRDNVDLQRMEQRKPPLPKEPPPAKGAKDKPAKPAAPRPGKGVSATDVADAGGMVLMAVEFYVDYQACIDEGKNPIDCKRDLTLAVGGVATAMGAGAVTMQSLAAIAEGGGLGAAVLAKLGITTATLSAAGPVLAAAGIPFAAYGVYKAGERWAHAPEVQAEERLRHQQMQVLMGYQRWNDIVRAKVGELQGLRARAAELCRETISLVQKGRALEAAAQPLLARLQGMAAAPDKESGDACGEAHRLFSAIVELQQRVQEHNAVAMDHLNMASDTAKYCNNKEEAGKVLEFYRHGKSRAARMPADVSAAKLKYNRMLALKADIDSGSSTLESAEQLRKEMAANFARIGTLADTAIKNREQINALNAQYVARKSEVGKLVAKLKRLLPEKPPSDDFLHEFLDARYKVSLWIEAFFALPLTINDCHYGADKPEQLVLIRGHAERRFDAASAAYGAIKNRGGSCSDFASLFDEAGRQMESMNDAIGDLDIHLALHDELPRQAEACIAKVNQPRAPAAAQCPANSAPVWNEEKQKSQCKCNQGYQINSARNGCEPKQAPVVVACNDLAKSGTNAPQTLTVNVGHKSGTAKFSYDMFNIPDQMIVLYGGQVLYDTGCAKHKGGQAIHLSGASDQVVIKVNPACQGGNTQWNFTFGCPGDAGSAPPETLAAGLLLLEMLTGDVTYYFRDPAEAQPLRNPAQLQTGAVVQTGYGSQAVLKSPAHTKITVTENSRAKVLESKPGKHMVGLIKGAVEVHRRDGTPGFDDVVISSREGLVVAKGTRYRVEKEERGTRVQVFEGSVQLTGNAIMKIYGYNVQAGKRAPATSMTLEAGEQAILMKTAAQETVDRK